MLHAQTTTETENESTENVMTNVIYVQNIGIPQRLTWTVQSAAVASGLSARAIWYAISRGEIETVTVGKRRLIPDSALRKFLGV
jgi:hypothetical protein